MKHLLLLLSLLMFNSSMALAREDTEPNFHEINQSQSIHRLAQSLYTQDKSEREVVLP